jgi:hypothetical protein
MSPVDALSMAFWMLSPGETGTVKAWTDMESIKIKVIEVPIIVKGELRLWVFNRLLLIYLIAYAT